MKRLEEIFKTSFCNMKKLMSIHFRKLLEVSKVTIRKDFR